MKLFKEKKEEKQEIIQNQGNIIIAPEKLKAYNFDILSSFLNTLISMADFEDYNYFTSRVAKNFYEQNKVYLENLNKIGNENIELIWENLNIFFKLNDLGVSQVKINLESKNINIFHYDSLFVRYLKSKTNFKLCSFYANLYSLILSNIFETDIKMIEEECGNETGKDFCLFTMA
jgi:predicted hydrocarbon binding protein